MSQIILGLIQCANCTSKYSDNVIYGTILWGKEIIMTHIFIYLFTESRVKTGVFGY